jgi:hypothetical protein
MNLCRKEITTRTQTSWSTPRSRDTLGNTKHPRCTRKRQGETGDLINHPRKSRHVSTKSACSDFAA